MLLQKRLLHMKEYPGTGIGKIVSSIQNQSSPKVDIQVKE